MTTAALAGGFIYADISVTSVTPASGTTDGGTFVSIAGGGFNEYALVYFGGQLLQDITVVTDFQITGTTPPNVAGDCTVTVTQETSSDSLVNGYEYIQAIQASSVYPGQGLTTGGDSVTIYGLGFTGSPTVIIGGSAATNVVVVSETEITCDTPVGTAGFADVAVDTSTITSGFQYILPLSISSIQPNADFDIGGKSIAITGYGFDPDATITIGGVSLEDEVVQSNTVIVGTVPNGTAGMKDVVVTKSGDDYIVADGFTYVASVQLASISPSTGTFNGGTSVTIDGENFLSSAVVTIGGRPLSNQVVVNGATITGDAPSGVSGTSDVIIQQTSVAGIDSDILLGAFTYSTDPNGAVGPKTIKETYSNILRLEDGLQATEQDIVTQDGDVTPMKMSKTSVEVTQPFEAIIRFNRG